ncbi:MAG: hypothetical protein IT379_22040, partial [Deltaproteobacteria bacterium]|nr:hypothetical protein [Deltaproteobacteria bacterium]
AASRAEPPWRLLLASLVTALVAMVALGLPGGDARHHASAPWFVLQKLAIVLGGLAIVAHLSREATRLPRWLAVLAGETLTLYVVHLLVLYWFPFSPHRVIGHTLPLHLAALVSLGMIALSIAVGLGAGPVRTRLARLIARNRDRVGVGFAADERARTARTDDGGADVERPGPRPSAV